VFVFVMLAVLFGVAQLGVISRAFGLVKQWDLAGWVMGVVLVLAGVLHFVIPAPFAAIVPPYLPAPELIVAVSGAAELVIGVGLATRRWRRVAAWLAVALFVAVLPANVYAAQSGVAVAGYPSSAMYRWVRVALQLPLIGWAIGVARWGSRGQ
jgi:uncharacterized membrane protein